MSVSLDPDMMEARNYLGALYLLSGDAAKAREQAQAVLAKDPKSSDGHMLMSNIYLKDKNLDMAIAEAQKAVEGEKKLEAYLQLSNLYTAEQGFESG